MFLFLLIVHYPVCVIINHFPIISLSLRHYRYYRLYFPLTLFVNLFSLCPFYSLLPLFFFCILFPSLSPFILPLFSPFYPVVGGGHLPNSIDVTNPPLPAVVPVPRKRLKSRFDSGYFLKSSNNVPN